MSIQYRIGDVVDRLAEIPDGSVDLIVTSPPFLALRSYLPADHPMKHREIGSEATPADFIDTLLGLSAEWARILAPHGSICVELGDTYSGNYAAIGSSANTGPRPMPASERSGPGWPLPKSMTGIPTLYTWSLAYGRNLLTGAESPAGMWRIRNLICWARPNPPVGALGDKFRPATSYITVACKSAKRYFDLDAVRTEPVDHGPRRTTTERDAPGQPIQRFNKLDENGNRIQSNPAGAPPLDWHADNHPEDGDWLWKLPTQPYSGKVPTVRRVPCGPDDGGERTASPDCPRHGDLPGQVPKALRDERAAERQAAQPRTSRNGSRPDVEPLPGFAPTDQSTEHSTEQPERSPACSGAATPHSNRTRRTDPAPSTSPAGTPCAQSPDGTARTSASPASSEPHPGIDESSTSSAGSASSREPRTTLDTDDTPRSERPCTCSFTKQITEYTSHYATFPMALPKRLIEAMCPQRVCTMCGKPSERITQVDGLHGKDIFAVVSDENERGTGLQGKRPPMPDITRTTLGWTDCGCSADGSHWRTGVVLDPFAGSGTTLEAAQCVGRHAIGIDLDDRNADLARDRVGMFLEVVA